jgi:PHD/YefM family antitoxin component YafN of YafNO toxin-antitoxin module
MATRKKRTSSDRRRPSPKGGRAVVLPKKPRVTRASADAGVYRCLELMTSGLWVRGRTAHEVAKELGVSPRTAEDYATQASRIIDVAMGEDRERIRNQMVATLEEVQRRALANPKKGELKAAIMAINSKASLLGLVDTGSKVAVQVNVQAYAQLDDASMLQKVEAQIAKLTELRARLLAKQSLLALPAHTEKEHGST